MGWGGKIGKMLVNSFTIGHGFLSTRTQSGEGSGAICRGESLNESFASSETGGPDGSRPAGATCSAGASATVPEVAIPGSRSV